MFSGIKCVGLRICWARLFPGARGVAVWWLAITVAAWLGGGTLQAQLGAVCQGSNITYGAVGNDAENPALCPGSNVVCQQPVLTSGPTYTPDPGCDPNSTSCGMSVTIGMQFPGNHVNAPFFNVGYSFEEVDLRGGGGSLVGECGYAGEELQADFGTVTVTGSVQCGVPATYTLNLISCGTCPGCPPAPAPPFCTKTTPVFLDLGAHANCPTDRRQCAAGDGGAGSGAGMPINAGSGDVTVTVPLFALAQAPVSLGFGLTYHSSPPRYPGLVSAAAGLGWTHPFAQTLRPIDAVASILYHITAEGFESEYARQPDGSWTAASPGELRGRVVAAGGQYQLTDLDGTTIAFDIPTGNWLSTTDRWGNSVQGGYDAAGNLVSVTDAEGRQVQLAYSGSQLVQITLPGGETWRLVYQGAELSQIFDPLHTGSQLGRQHPGPGGRPVRQLLGQPMGRPGDRRRLPGRSELQGLRHRGRDAGGNL